MKWLGKLPNALLKCNVKIFPKQVSLSCWFHLYFTYMCFEKHSLTEKMWKHKGGYVCKWVGLIDMSVGQSHGCGCCSLTPLVRTRLTKEPVFFLSWGLSFYNHFLSEDNLLYSRCILVTGGLRNIQYHVTAMFWFQLYHFYRTGYSLSIFPVTLLLKLSNEGKMPKKRTECQKGVI